MRNTQTVAYRVPENREIEGVWQPGETGMQGDMQAWTDGILGLNMSEDREHVFLRLYQRSDPNADMDEIGALVLKSDEADMLGRALLARRPSGEDLLGEKAGQGLIGLRIPPGLA